MMTYPSGGTLHRPVSKPRLLRLARPRLTSSRVAGPSSVQKKIQSQKYISAANNLEISPLEIFWEISRGDVFRNAGRCRRPCLRPANTPGVREKRHCRNGVGLSATGARKVRWFLKYVSNRLCTYLLSYCTHTVP